MSVLPLARIGTVVSSPCRRSAARTWRFDQRVQRPQRRGAGADLVGQRRQAKIDALSGVALALAVERLMLAELLEQDHRQQVRAGEAARRDMERRRRLRDRLAFAGRRSARAPSGSPSIDAGRPPASP